MAGSAGVSPSLKVVDVKGSTTSSKFMVPQAWQPIRRLGSGAYATVAAFQTGKGDERLAVKKIERVFDHPVLALRTLREVRLLAHFNHPNLLRLTKFYVDGPEFKDGYLCLEMMDSDLHQLIHDSKGLSNYQIQCVMYQIMRGLLCLRTAHVVHRDMKPGNVLVKADGGVKIADLGLARAIDANEDDHDEAVLTEYVVTRYYRAPEVVLTATHYTYAVDMWSAGCILGEMLTGRPVFEGKDSLDQIKKIVGVIGSQSADEMSWIPKSSPSWKFVEKCNKASTGEAFQKLLKDPKLDPNAADLLAAAVRFDPSRRITVEDALVHPYHETFNANADAEVSSARAVRPMDWFFDKDLCFDERGKPKPFDAKRFRQAFYDSIAALEEQAGGASPKAAERGRSPRNAGKSPRNAGKSPRAADKSPGGRGRSPRSSQTSTAASTPQSAAPTPGKQDAPVRRRWEKSTA